MLKRVEVENFKSLLNTCIDLRKLNIFSGINNTGKSSMLQAIAMGKHCTIDNFKYFKINTKYYPFVNIGNIFSTNATSNYTSLKFIDSKDEYIKYKFNFMPKGIMTNLSVDHDISNDKHELFLSEMDFLSPELVISDNMYNEFDEENFDDFRDNKLNYIVDYLHDTRTTTALSDIYDSLKEWINYIIPNTIQDKFKSVDSLYELYTKSGKSVRYLIPIVISLIKAKPDSIIIIENPETNLHSYSQVKLCELIAKCTNLGVQIFIETQSEHILNGIRIAVKNKLIQPNDIGIYDFYNQPQGNDYCFIEINENGKINTWLKGFFDGWDKELDALLF